MFGHQIKKSKKFEEFFNVYQGVVMSYVIFVVFFILFLLVDKWCWFFLLLMLLLLLLFSRTDILNLWNDVLHYNLKIRVVTAATFQWGNVLIYSRIWKRQGRRVRYIFFTFEILSKVIWGLGSKGLKYLGKLLVL